MDWTVEYTTRSRAQLDRLGRPAAQRIADYLERRVATLADPRRRGKELTGNYAGQWVYRVGDYRVICDIQDAALIVLVVRVGHRSRVYR